MLVINRAKTPCHHVEVIGADWATRVAARLIGQSISFYCEPQPDDGYTFDVNVEALHRLQAITIEEAG